MDAMLITSMNILLVMELIFIINLVLHVKQILTDKLKLIHVFVTRDIITTEQYVNNKKLV